MYPRKDECDEPMVTVNGKSIPLEAAYRRSQDFIYACKRVAGLMVAAVIIGLILRNI